MRRFVGSVLLFLPLLWISCGDDEDTAGAGTSGLDDQTGQSCAAPSDCFPNVVVNGDVQCLDRVDGGYCTHLCTSDADCCAVDGECDPADVQVCGPFESTGMMMCFISCEKEDISGDADAHCQRVHPDFICRSTGGGSDNRKVCVPGGNGPCSRVEDCSAGFENCCDNDAGELRCYDASTADGLTCL